MVLSRYNTNVPGKTNFLLQQWLEFYEFNQLLVSYI